MLLDLHSWSFSENFIFGELDICCNIKYRYVADEPEDLFFTLNIQHEISPSCRNTDMTETQILGPPVADDDDTQTLVDDTDYQLHKKWAIQKTPASLISRDSHRRLECLVYDMRMCSRNSQAQERLNKAKTHPYYLGPPYISVQLGAELLKSKWRHKDENLRGHLEKSIALNGGQYGSYIFGPALASYLQIGTELEENEAFRKYYPQFCQASRICPDDVTLENEVMKKI